ncbi:hypothetical protein [Neisseria sp. P0014.S009]|uniref:hypothetical protein n=1 Tax=unclassified Neisseria TaxID=2623750 RepID=UPI003F7FDDC3
MKQKQHIDLNKVDLTQLDSESMDRLITAFKGTEHYKKSQKRVKIGSIILFFFMALFVIMVGIS